MKRNRDTVVLIDGKNLCHRVHWTHLQLSSRGRPTSILFGGLMSLLSLNKRLPGAPLVWVWDGSGKTWRHKLKDAAYKANREIRRPEDKKEDIIRLHQQIPELKRFLRMLGLRSYEVSHLEGDDLLGMLTMKICQERWFDNVIILSSDRDFYQFIGTHNLVNVRVCKGMKDGNLAFASAEDIEKEFGIGCKDFTRLRAFIGDKTDNIIPAIKGVGPVTARDFVLHGVDASRQFFNDLPAKVRRQYRKPFKIRGTVVDIPANWMRIRTNYILSQIVIDPQDKKLPRSVRRDLLKMFSRLTWKRFFRNPKAMTDENYKSMRRWLDDYELQELAGLRHTLWGLP